MLPICVLKGVVTQAAPMYPHQALLDDLSKYSESALELDVDLEDGRSGGRHRQALGVDLPVVVINLARRTDRWRAVSNRLAAVGLTRLIRAPAVEGASLSEAVLGRIARTPSVHIERAPDSHNSLTLPAIGCFLSHLAIWRCASASRCRRLLVLEDDVVPAKGFEAGRLRSMLESLPAEAGLVLLGRTIMNGMAERAGGDGLARIYYFNGTFAYLVTPAACATLYAAMLPIRRHIDHQLSEMLIARRQEMAAWSLEPPLFEHDWSLYSDCYVPISGESEADRELAAHLESRRRLLLTEGRLLLPVAE